MEWERVLAFIDLSGDGQTVGKRERTKEKERGKRERKDEREFISLFFKLHQSNKVSE